jgi:fructose-bisphosphate aldolase/6-deoxy-5-ketofructose 1-phosphate synthase
MDFLIPADVPQNSRAIYTKNLEQITKGTGRLFLFAGDQKVEHLNSDFVGEGISPEDATPEHLFNIASKAKIGAFAAQLGLIAKYGADFQHVPFIVKLNSKSDLIKTNQKDPYSATWTSVEDVVRFKQSSNLQITGVGYTIYPGSEYESQMFAEAAKLIFEAHQHGLVTVIWAYPRGKAVVNEKDPHLVAGVAGIVASMGADFVKVNPPHADNVSSAEMLKEAVLAAGRTKVICAGGGSMGVKQFLQTLHDQIHIAGCAGNATGRNIHQKSLDEAVRFCSAIYAVTVEDKTVDEAMEIYTSQ